NDFQVKIHGLRIELGEIEQQLGHCAGVEGALVQACDDEQGDKRLVAWVVAKPEARLEQRLREQLKETLPDYMIPFAIVRLDAFPLSPNGKLDRKTLPQPVLQARKRKLFCRRTMMKSGCWPRAGAIYWAFPGLAATMTFSSLAVIQFMRSS
ncbi:AMP-binding enzyme, partial [Erwinia sp.]|uniref:AMP-binding enzyme n=1 Tax=Erwinia citreus TaxID=558 RepID=UPI00289B01E9